VDGWQCVVKRGEFKVGDTGIYFEIDSFIPIPRAAKDEQIPECHFNFLRKDAREWNGLFGVRIRSIKLRGQISQGLLLSSKTIPSPLPLKRGETLDNLAKHFGVVKWEREEPEQEMRKDSWVDPIIRLIVPKRFRKYVFDFIYKAQRSRKQKTSSFPSFIPKTDEERIQNIIGKKLGCTEEYEVTTKLNGSSMTVYVKDGVFGHCSRNVKLGLEDGSRFSQVVKKYSMQTLLPGILNNLATLTGRDHDYAIQGELCGPGIQGNYEQLDELEFFVFRVFSIDRQEYLNPEAMETFLCYLITKGLPLKRVPILGKVSLGQFTSINSYLEYAEGPSFKAPKREGVVFQRMDGKDSFKVISNSYLLKGGD
jgi:hypothetical protein